jgi:hypothetical protein
MCVPSRLVTVSPGGFVSLGFGAVRGGFGAPLGGEVGCGPDMHNGNPSEDPNAKQMRRLCNEAFS